MRKTIFAGAIAALVWGGSALAADCPEHIRDSQASVSSPDRSIDTQAKVDSNVSVDRDRDLGPGIGGSGEVNVPQDSDARNRSQTICPPSTTTSETTRSSTVDENGRARIRSDESMGYGGSADVTETRIRMEDQDRYRTNKESTADMRGLTVTAGGGVEGYSFSLAPEISPGPAWDVAANIRPTKVLGVELSYSGAVNELRSPTGVSGPDLIRNGGQAALTLGLTAAPVQPYLLGGIGFSRYNFRGAATTMGFHDDTAGQIPVAAGLRTHVGNFTADARFGYNFLFDQQFAATPSTPVGAGSTTTDFSNAGRYMATLNVGTTF